MGDNHPEPYRENGLNKDTAGEESSTTTDRESLHGDNAKRDGVRRKASKRTLPPQSSPAKKKSKPVCNMGGRGASVDRKPKSEVLAILRAISTVLIEGKSKRELAGCELQPSPPNLSEFWRLVSGRVEGVDDAENVLKDILGNNFYVASEWINRGKPREPGSPTYELFPLDVRSETTVAIGQLRYNRKVSRGSRGWNTVSRGGHHIQYQTSQPGQSAYGNTKRTEDSSIAWDNLRLLGAPERFLVGKSSGERPVGELLQKDVAAKVHSVMSEVTQSATTKRAKLSSQDVSERVRIHSTDLFSCYDKRKGGGRPGPQEVHLDINPDDRDKAREVYGLEPLVGICPLTSDGSLLYVWDTEQKTTKVVFVPLGSVLLLGSGTWHAGNLCYGSEENSNQRLHFVACHGEIEKLFAGTVQRNHYDKDGRESDRMMGMIGDRFMSRSTYATSEHTGSVGGSQVDKMITNLLWEKMEG